MYLYIRVIAIRVGPQVDKSGGQKDSLEKFEFRAQYFELIVSLNPTLDEILLHPPPITSLFPLQTLQNTEQTEPMYPMYMKKPLPKTA